MNKKDNLIEIIKSFSDNMSDLELYQNELKDRTSIFELFFDNYFRKSEGMPCSHDKSVFVSKRVNKYLEDGVNSPLIETYGEYQLRGGNIGGINEFDKICYWCPKTIKDTKEAVEILFNYLCMNINFFKEKLGDYIMNKEELEDLLHRMLMQDLSSKQRNKLMLYIETLETKNKQLKEETNKDYTSVYLKGFEDGKDKIKQDLIKYLEDKVREYTPNLKTQWGYTEDGYRYKNINAEVYTKRPHETYQEILDRIKGE